VTIAICIRCGETKFGAWTRCEACGFEPASTTDLAKSLVATDHYFSVDYLHHAAEGLKRGRPLVFSDKQIAEGAAQIEAQMYFLDNFDSDAGTIKCVKCGRVFSTDIDTEEVECPDCLRGMPGGSGPSASNDAVSHEHKVCVACGTSLPIDAQICPTCARGMKESWPESPAKLREPEVAAIPGRKSSLLLTLGGITIVVVGCILLGVLLFGFAWLIDKLLPVALLLSLLGGCAFVPLFVIAFVSTPRRNACGEWIMRISEVWGVALWMWGILALYELWGGVGFLLGVMSVGVGTVILVVIALLLHGKVLLSLGVVLAVGIILAVRFMGAIFASQRKPI